MEENVNILFVIIFVLSLICILLAIKVFVIKKSIKEISTSLNRILSMDTNNLITTSSSDKNIINLVEVLNNELKELRKQKLHFETGNQELQRTITNISHDLRTPLTAIKGYLDLMKDDNLSQNQEKYLNIVYKKSNELKELTEQLFDFSKTIDIDVRENKENCCINDILEETLVSYYTVFKEKNIIPNINICSEKIYREVNKVSIIRVFENILSNVVKYSSGDFQVLLKNDGRIIFSNKASELDATTAQKIFDRYFTVENARKSTGLGLSIAKQLIELNGGTVFVKYLDGNLIIEIEL